MKRRVLLVNFVLFIALCASAAAWIAQGLKPPARPVAAAPLAEPPPPLQLQAASTLFGARAPASVVATNYALKGVVVARRGADSVAIIAAEGKPPQAVGIGGEVVPGVTVKEVHPQFVLLSEGGRDRRLELQEKASP